MLRFFQNHRKKQAQSLIEYALLIILTLAGVMVMGPYVIRSWNANVKGWDDSFKDSFQDPIGASPPGGFDVSCSCSNIVPCTTPPCCGYGDRCLETEDSVLFICNPVSCQSGLDTCTPNANCCSQFVPLPVPDRCNEPPCAVGEVLYTRYCGNDNPLIPVDPFNPSHANRWECRPNANCAFRCTNPPDPVADPEYAPAMCPGDDFNLLANQDVTYVNPGFCSTPLGSSPKCQWECQGSFVPGFGATSCECPSGSLNNNGTCVIDCGISEGECENRPNPNPFPIPNSCSDLNAADCALYDAACSWSPGGCSEIRPCAAFVTNVTLTSPTGPAFTRCDIHPWCQWTGGGAFCCSAVFYGTCLPGDAAAGDVEDAGCLVDHVQGCCQGAAIALQPVVGGGTCDRNPAYICPTQTIWWTCGSAPNDGWPGCVWNHGAGSCNTVEPCTQRTTAVQCAAGLGCSWTP